jgi:DMSO reductase family type II enzyme chaperone
MSAAIQTSAHAPSSGLLSGLDPYRIFAACFGQPSLERFGWLSGKKFQALLEQLAGELGAGCASMHPGRFRDYAAYEAAYLALFEVGVPEPPVPLLESAHSHRAVPQEVVLECVNFYEVLGLRPSGSSFPADHLVTQLEFLAAAGYLRETKTDPEEVATLQRLEADFLERHLLSWLPTALMKLSALKPPLFARLLELLYAYVQQQLVRIAPRSSCS